MDRDPLALFRPTGYGLLLSIQLVRESFAKLIHFRADHKRAVALAWVEAIEVLVIVFGRMRISKPL